MYQLSRPLSILDRLSEGNILYTAGILRYRRHMDPPGWNDQIRTMFGNIAHRYDFMNTLMSFGMDRLWRKRVVALADLPEDGVMLDAGAGTGRISLEASRTYPHARIVAIDLTGWMMKVGVKTCPPRVKWACADVLALPFEDAVFDAVASGFLVRNVPDIRGAFEEQCRVVRPGGKVICLDAGPPPENVLNPLVKAHLNWVIPRLGALITGDEAAYRYLPASTQAFKTARQIASLMSAVGFVEVAFERHMFGAINIVCGKRPRW